MPSPRDRPFLLAQFLDVAIFNRLRANPRWWRAPFISSLIGSVLDTLLFWGVAYSASFAFVDTFFAMPDGSLGFPTPFWDVGPEVPLWVSLALGDFAVKMTVALVLLAPYGALRRLISDRILDPKNGLAGERFSCRPAFPHHADTPGRSDAEDHDDRFQRPDLVRRVDAKAQLPQAATASMADLITNAAQNHTAAHGNLTA